MFKRVKSNDVFKCIRTELKCRSWQLFLAGVCSVPLWNLIAGYVSAPDWHRRTFYGSYLYAPLLLLSFLSCVCAPLFANVRWFERLGLAVLGAVGFGISLFFSVLAGLVVFGLPID